MPSDNQQQKVQQALLGARKRFRSAIAQTIDEVEGLLGQQHDHRIEREQRALGGLAQGRIDAQQFAALGGQGDSLNPELREQIQQAQQALKELHQNDEDLYQIQIKGHTTLRDGVADAYARLGRAFGAARTIALARTKRFRLDRHGGYLNTFPFRDWNPQERQVGPPLVAQLSGGHLWPGGLSEFLDGNIRIVLLVEGPAPAAPLVSLITPQTLVGQTSDPQVLESLQEHDGPAILAWLTSPAEGQAEFLHQPGAQDPTKRLDVFHTPDPSQLQPIGGASVAQQIQQLQQLNVLATNPPIAAERTTDTAAQQKARPQEDEAGQLAGWLLRQSGLDDLEAR